MCPQEFGPDENRPRLTTELCDDSGGGRRVDAQTGSDDSPRLSWGGCLVDPVPGAPGSIWQ
jgi:hypothetical protein